MSPEIKITERGWPGHFTCADKCLFRRNTLIELGDTRVIISTVGAMVSYDEDKVFVKQWFSKIGSGWYYETRAFDAIFSLGYWDSDTRENLTIESKCEIDDMQHHSDKEANEMHDAVVSEFIDKLNRGEDK